MEILCQVLIVFTLISSSICARILAYIPSPSYSHQVVFRPLWVELSLRGHHVTLLTTDPINNVTLSNITEVDLSFSYEIVNKALVKLQKASIIESVRIFAEGFIEIIDDQLGSHDVKRVLNGRPFDLIIVEFVTKIPFAIAKKHQCPSIAVTSLEAFDAVYEVFGVPTHPIIYPSYLLPFTKTDTLFERLLSALFFIALKIYTYVFDNFLQDPIIIKHFGENASTSFETSRNISLLLENTGPLLGRVRPRVPTVVPVGGIHRVPSKPLPEKLKAVLDLATLGFIYFSMGSNIKSKDYMDTMYQIILETFSELPYTVLWKFDEEMLHSIPKNVYLSKWFPQNDVLRHPNIKLFITQGGLQSIEEALIAKVPIVGIPFIADQGHNVRHIVERGLGLSLDYKTFNRKQFKEVIIEVISNPNYRTAVAKMFKLAEDQPISSLELAVWWVEYVLRHKGTAHLRSHVLDVPWYQYYLMDISIFILTVLVALLFVLYLFFKMTKTIFRRNVSKLKIH